MSPIQIDADILDNRDAGASSENGRYDLPGVAPAHFPPPEGAPRLIDSFRVYMQFQLVPGFLIFLGSYLPLAIILAIQDIPNTWWARPLCRPAGLRAGTCDFIPFEHPALALAFFLISITAILLAWLSLRKIAYPFQIEVKKTKPIPNEIINYTFPYVVSFMGIAYGDQQKLSGFIVFLLWMFAITFKSGQILMNPLLLILGWRLHEATISINHIERDVRVLCRGPLTIGPHKAQTIQDFYIV